MILPQVQDASKSKSLLAKRLTATNGLVGVLAVFIAIMRSMVVTRVRVSVFRIHGRFLISMGVFRWAGRGRGR